MTHSQLCNLDQNHWVAEWLRMLIFRALIACHLNAVGLSLAQITCQVLPAGGQVFFLMDLPFSPHSTID